MNDEELASKCVDLIDNFDRLPKGVSAHEFVQDWQVAGAMLDKVHDLPEPFKWIVVMRAIRRIPLGNPLERPIIEACAEVLQ